MILGLPWASWLLLLVAVGSGLTLSLAFYLAHRVELTEGNGSSGDSGAPGSSTADAEGGSG